MLEDKMHLSGVVLDDVVDQAVDRRGGEAAVRAQGQGRLAGEGDEGDLTRHHVSHLTRERRLAGAG